MNAALLTGDRARDAVTGWLTAALAAGRRTGEVRDDLPEALQAHLVVAVVRAMDEWSVRHVDTLTDVEVDNLVAGQLDTLRRLVGS